MAGSSTGTQGLAEGFLGGKALGQETGLAGLGQAAKLLPLRRSQQLVQTALAVAGIELAETGDSDDVGADAVNHIFLATEDTEITEEKRKHIVY